MRTLKMLAVALATLMSGATFAALSAAPAGAQLLPGPGFGRGRAGYSPIIAARAGWSIRDSSPSLGAELRFPIPIPVLRPSIGPGGDLVFQSGLTERQGMLDVTLGLLQPIFFGGGPMVLSSVFDDGGGERETKNGYTVVAGIRGGRIGRLSADASFRYVHVDDLHPRFLTLSFGYPLMSIIRR